MLNFPVRLYNFCFLWFSMAALAWRLSDEIDGAITNLEMFDE